MDTHAVLCYRHCTQHADSYCLVLGGHSASTSLLNPVLPGAERARGERVSVSVKLTRYATGWLTV